MKTKLTGKDPAGWYIYDEPEHNRSGMTHWEANAGTTTTSGFTNFRRLVEAVEPEIIEGTGQLVTEANEGWYWVESQDRAKPWFKPARSRFHIGSRYAKAIVHVFPSKKVIPPKPELVLIEFGGVIEWAVPVNQGYMSTKTGLILNNCQCDIVEVPNAG